MSLAKTLLNSLDDYEVTEVDAVDEEPHIIVGSNREITVPAKLKLIAVKGDKDIETVTIDCVRYWDNHDLSTFAIYINYILPSGDEGTYIPKNITKLDDIFTFDWKIGNEITYAQGKLTFWIVAKLTDDSGDLIKQWSSLQNSDCSIAQGGDKIYVPEKQTDQDVISQAISISRESAETAEQQANLAIEAANKAALDASRAAEEEVSRIIGELGVVQELGDNPNSVVSQLKVTNEFNQTNAKINRNSKRITNLEQGLPAELFETDGTVAYQKDVPENVLPYASINRIGGILKKSHNLLNIANAKTIGGLGKITIDVDGTYIKVAPSSSLYGIQFVNDGIFEAGKTYYLNADASQHHATNYGFKFQYTDGTSGQISPYGVFTAEKEVSNLNYYISWGTGYETETIVSNIQAVEGDVDLPYEPYWEGIREAKVTAIKSVGANLFDYESYRKNGKTYVIKVIPNKTLYRNAQISVGKYWEIYDNADALIGTFFSFDFTASNPLVLPSNAAYIRSRDNDFGLLATLYLGYDSNTTYRPHVKRTLPIPETVQAIHGYGWGVSESANNYIDFEKQQFVQSVEKIDLGSLTWSNMGGYGSPVFRTPTPIENIKPVSNGDFASCVCEKYDTLPYNALYYSGDSGIAVDSNGNLAVLDSAYSDVTSFKEAMNGVFAYIELAEPIITDISDLLSPDNFIEVEGGGVIAFENEYEFAVPSEVEYQVEV